VIWAKSATFAPKMVHEKRRQGEQTGCFALLVVQTGKNGINYLCFLPGKL